METKEEIFELTITADSVTSTCDEFTVEKLADGWQFRPLSVCFNEGEPIKATNKTLPRLACEKYEEFLDSLSEQEKQEFPIYRPTLHSKIIRGIYTDRQKCIERYGNGVDEWTMDYPSNSNENCKFAFYYNHIFTNIVFVQECLKRYGEKNDKFILTYRRKNEEEMKNAKPEDFEQLLKDVAPEYRIPYSKKLRESKNIIFRGAPGTGKSYLAKEIAADIVSNGYTKRFDDLTDEEKKRVEFVQFHPSYDYTDFVEGLRPISNENGSIGFERRDGVFKKFVDRARDEYETFPKSVNVEEVKKYVFIIDEINRGEISKIFGELFFTIDPGYRGKLGEVSTQYANLHDDPEKKFYIPENVYIIGTMNDIDRSVESFDFAMRRRFRFIEVTAEASMKMLRGALDEEVRKEAERRMSALNEVIKDTEGLNENYQIGASYFLKLNTMDFDTLWIDYLQPLLQEYTNGMYDAEVSMEKFADAYGYKESGEGWSDETAQDNR